MKTTLRILIALVMTAIGLSHFVSPDPFVRIVPHFLPWPLALVYISGACEIAGGIGLLPRRTRKLASWGLIALYLAVFPANINMAIHNIQLSEGGQIPVWAMWARLPMQALFIALVWWLGRSHIHSEGLSGEKGE
ncbi:MAG: DoxX family protein [Kofleriaceae bacterium]|nr:DoxX family protein [Kofleriaceae bacterium]